MKFMLCFISIAAVKFQRGRVQSRQNFYRRADFYVLKKLVHIVIDERYTALRPVAERRDTLP